MSIKMNGTSPDPARDDFQRADIDPNLTRSVESGPPVGQESTASLPAKSGSTTTGNIRPFYASDNVEEIDQVVGDQGAVAPGKSPNSWIGSVGADDQFRSADPYRNQGLSEAKTDRGYLENQG